MSDQAAISTSRFLYLLKAVFRGNRIEDNLSEELRLHLQREIEKSIAAGMSPKQARHPELRAFGAVDQVKEECRDLSSLRFIEGLWQDARHALRGMRRSPGFTAVVVLSLALGIGANIGIFSLLDTVMLRPLPVHHPEELVELLQKYPNQPRQSFEHFRDNNHIFSALTRTGIDTQTKVSVDGSEQEP